MWFRHVQRVRYQETDRMGVVYHANYANWLEIGRTEWIRSTGLTYKTIEERGLLLPVMDLQLHFHKPARYDDVIGIYTRVVGFSGVRLEFANEIRRLAEEQAVRPSEAEASDEPEGELLAAGGTRHVWVNREWKPLRIDKEAPDLYGLIAARGLQK